MPKLPDPPWGRVYADVKLTMPGLTDAVFWNMVYQVLNDFFDRTNIWTEEAPMNVEPNVLSYNITLTKFGIPNRLMLVYNPAYSPPDKQWVQGGVGMMKPGVITLRYAPSEAATWSAVVAKTLSTVGSDGIPDIDPSDWWIIDKYADGFMYGIMGRLQLSPAKTYSNAKLGASNWQTYVAERSKARTDALKANVFGGQRWMYPQSFATTTRKGWT
jgi:hypothetical protein